MKAKSRKIVQHLYGTGGRSPLEAQLTPLENRALTVWGKVTVTGVPSLSPLLGFREEVQVAEEVDPERNIEAVTGTLEEPEQIRIEVLSSGAPTRQRTRQTPIPLLAERLLERTTESGTEMARLRETVDKHLTEHLSMQREAIQLQREAQRETIQLQREAVQLQREGLQQQRDAENAKIRIRREQLDFEIEKFKLLNPSFRN